MNRHCLPLFILLLTGGSLSAQKLNKTVHITFDSTGQMVKYPTPVVRRIDNIDFTVSVPKAMLDSQLVAFKALLQTDHDSVASANISKAYNTFFLGTIPDYTNAVTDMLANWPSPCQPRIADGTGHVPLSLFFNNLYETQFEILVQDRSRTLDTIPLTADTAHCADICVNFTGSLSLSRYKCKTCPSMPPDSLRFQLVRFNPITKTAADWYKVVQKRGFPEVTSDEIIQQLTRLDAKKPSTLGDLDAKLIKWFLDWFWYSGGRLVLDPFRQVSKATSSNAADNANTLDSTIRMLRERLAFNDSVKRHVRYTEWKADEFERVQAKGAEILADIRADSIEREKLLKIANASVAATIGVGTVINQVDVYLSGDGVVRPQKQFNSAGRLSNAWVRERRQQRVSEVPQTERLFVVVYNIDSSASVRNTEKPGTFDDQAEFTKNGVNALNFSVSSSATQLSGIVSALQSFRIPVNNIPPGSALNGNEDAVTAAVKLLKVLLDDYAKGNITYPLNADLFAHQAYTPPVYATFARPMTILSAPYSDTLAIRQVLKKDTVSILSFVNVGKLRHFQLAAGLTFLTRPNTMTTIDTTGGGFKVKTASSTAAAVLGIKFYPVRSFNRDNGIIPRYPLRHLSVFGGFNMLHPLNDFYAGIGYDIVPGLSVIWGKNYFVRTAYQVQNNQIISSERVFQTGNSFFAATVDPVLFFQIVKNFF